MSHTICLRCLKRAVLPQSNVAPVAVAGSAAFSTSAHRAANPPKKKAVVARPQAGRTLRLAKNKRAQTTRPPASGERKALRKRVILSNTNALEVSGLQDLQTDNVRDATKLKALQGQVAGFGDDTVDALRALEAFKATQGWSLFRRPAALVRKETVELAEQLQSVKDSKKVLRQMVYGAKGSGKSVLQLQGMAMAYLQGWVVVHFPEARDITIAHTSYQPQKTPEGETIYIQPHYTARMLQNIVSANRGLLDSLQITKKHDLGIPVQSNITLTRLAELGVNDVTLAYPVWQALWSELTMPSQSGKKEHLRPPIFVSMDGVDHIMRISAYLNSEAQQIHAHDLAIARDFASLLDGKTTLPNGGMIMAATSASTRPAVPTLDHILARRASEQVAQEVSAVHTAMKTQAQKVQSSRDLDVAGLDNLLTMAVEEPMLARQVSQLQHTVLRHVEENRPIADLRTFLETFKIKLPEWNTYVPIDERVAAAMETVNTKKVRGLSKEEARGVMEYYARSGMMRAAVTEGLVSEKWSLAGNGIVGELEQAAVRARF